MRTNKNNSLFLIQKHKLNMMNQIQSNLYINISRVFYSCVPYSGPNETNETN